jgi:hypothetical protein
MWEREDEEEGSTNEEENDQGMSKKELVDGLLAAVSYPHTHRVQLTKQRKPRSPLSSPKPAQEIARRSTSTTSHLPITPVSSDSSSSNNAKDTEATPKAVPRTRSKARVKVDGSVTRVRRPLKGVRERLLKARSKSMGGQGDREERKARFGDDVKSPAHGLLK